MSEGQSPPPHPPSHPRGRTHHSIAQPKDSPRAPGNSYRPKKRNDLSFHQYQQAELNLTTSLATAPAPTSTPVQAPTQETKRQNWDEISDSDSENAQLPTHGPPHSTTKQYEESTTSLLLYRSRHATSASPHWSTKGMPRVTNKIHRSRAGSATKQAQIPTSHPHQQESFSAAKANEEEETNLDQPLNKSTAAVSPVDNDISSIVVSPPKSRANRLIAGIPSSTTDLQPINPSFPKEIDTSRLFDRSMRKAINQRSQTTPPVALKANTAEESNMVPTWTARPLSLRQGERDSNRVEVLKARQWGQAPLVEEAERFNDAPLPERRAEEACSETPALEPAQPSENPWGRDPETGDWDKNAQLQQWAKAIPPSAAPANGLELDPQPRLSDTLDDGLPSRPSSVPQLPAPQTIFYSDDDIAPTPALTHRGESPLDVDEVALAVSRTEATEIARNVKKSPTIISVTVGSTGELAETASVADQLDPSPRRRRDSRQHDNPMWWKRSPHPMYSPKFAAQRLMVEFPFPIRISHVRNLLIDHFSKYGPVRATFHYEPMGDSCEKGFVVFNDVESVGNCLKDPQVNICHFRSGPNVAPREFDLVIKQTKAEALTKTVFVRCDPKASLPFKLYIDAVPKKFWNNTKVTWFAHVRPPGANVQRLWDNCKSRTGKAPKEVGVIDMTVSEIEFMPILCNYFAEICKIIPPTATGEGWLITVAGPSDGKNLMAELNKIPGILTRWANEMDGIYPSDGPESLPDSNSNPRSPLTQLKRELFGPPSQPDPILPLSFPAENHGPEMVDSTLGGGPTINTTINGQPDHQMPVQTSPRLSGPYSPTHPGLHRQVMYVSRGRLLTEDANGHFYDERAVFIGRLDRRETDISLHRRFSRYGKVYKIESNAYVKPLSVLSGYTSARILYHSKEAAQLAIQNENGKESFGSHIRVELRRVLPMDVTMKEMYLTDSGMALSPSMVSQTSPTPSNRQSPVTAPIFPPPPPPFPMMMQPPMRTVYPVMQYTIPLPVPDFGQQGVPNSHPAPPPPTGATTAPTMPPQFASYMQMPYPPPAPPSGPGPTPSSSNYPLPFFCATLGMGYTTNLPPYLQTGPAPPNPTPPLSPQYQASAADPPSIPVGASIPPPASLSPTADPGREVSSRSSRLRPLEFREVGGMMKAIYDPEELKAYCSENGISLPKDMTPPSSEEGREVSASSPTSHDSARGQSASSSESNGPTIVPLPTLFTHQRSASEGSSPSARSRQHQAPSPDSCPISQSIPTWREHQRSTTQSYCSKVRLVPVPVPVSMPLSPPPTAPVDLQPLFTTRPLVQSQLGMDRVYKSHPQERSTLHSAQAPAKNHHQARRSSGPYHPPPVGSLAPAPSAPQSEPRSQAGSRDSSSSQARQLPARPAAAPSIASSYHRRDSIVSPIGAHSGRAPPQAQHSNRSHVPNPQGYTHQRLSRPEQQQHHQKMCDRAAQQQPQNHQNVDFAVHHHENQQGHQYGNGANSQGQSENRPPRARRPDPLGRDVPLSNSPPNPEYGGW